MKILKCEKKEYIYVEIEEDDYSDWTEFRMDVESKKWEVRMGMSWEDMFNDEYTEMKEAVKKML